MNKIPVCNKKITTNGVSIVIPAYNAERTICDCLTAANDLEWSGNIEIVLVNDGSLDKTGEIASSFSGVQVINVPNGGAARATNIGIQAASYEMLVSLDSDAILEKDWLIKIAPYFDEPDVAAVAGYAITGNKSLVGKIMGYDVEMRLDSAVGYTDHLYTMNTAYRRQALLEIGMFDENLRIAAYDVAISRKLKAAGYKLILNKEAKCTHYWRDDLKGYLKQQYNYAYYRMEIIRMFGRPHDRIAGLGMNIHALITPAVLLAAAIGSFLVSPYVAILLLLLLIVHFPEMIKFLFSKRGACSLALPFLFTLRNFSWSWAILIWVTRNGLGGLIKKGYHD